MEVAKTVEFKKYWKATLGKATVAITEHAVSKIMSQCYNRDQKWSNNAKSTVILDVSHGRTLGN